MENTGTPIDTSSLIYLAKADGLRPVHECLGPLLAPPSVWLEAVEAGEARGAPELHRILTAAAKGWVRRKTLDRRQRQRVLALIARFNLGSGESEVLALGTSRRLVIIDEYRGTRTAEFLGIVAASTLVLPVMCADRGVLGAPEALRLLHDIARHAGPSAGEVQRVEQRIKEYFQ